MSKDVRITIDTGNAAFDDGNREYEVARILREAADRIENGAEDFTLRDINGNKVGSVTTG
jgi:hypothetical protein